MRIVLGSEANRLQIRTVTTRPETPVTYLHGLYDVDFDRFALSNGQILIYNTESDMWNAVDKFVSGNTPQPNPSYGDIWFYQDEGRPYMWVNDGYSDFWLDFLPPVF